MKKFYLLLTVLMMTLTTVMSQTITTGAISPTSVCAGATISIPYTILGTFTAGNFFVAQLSNSTGAFTTPILLDSVYTTAAGTINAQIPYGTAAGTGYLIRVIGRTPAIIGTANATALTINANPLLSENANYAQLGNALNFDGSNDKVTVTDNTVGNFGTGAFTVEFWMNTTKGRSNLISKRSVCGAVSLWNIKLNGNNVFAEFLSDITGAGYTGVSSSVSVTDGQWHHVAVTRNTAGLVTIFIDGVNTGSGTNGLATPTNVGTATTNTANVTIAASACGLTNSPSVANFKGSMDEVRLWGTERTLTQINASRFLGSLGTDNAGLVAYYDFNQGTAEGTNTTVTTLTDRSVNVKNATLTGFALTGKTSNWINSGVSNFCIASTYSFSNSVAGGVWSVTPGTGTATITTAGVLTAVTAGTVTVNYTLTTGTCSVVSKSLVNITSNTLPAAPTAGSAQSTVCQGGSTQINATFTEGANIIMYIWTTPTPGTGTVLCGALNNGPLCGTGVINATTTFYLGTTNYATGCQSATRFPVVATVLVPAAPTGVNGTRCGTGTVNLSTTVSSTDYTVDWYAAATGGTALLSGNLSYTTPSLTAPATSFPRYNETIYYAQTRSSSIGCVSATRTPVSARASHLPVAPTNATSTPVCGVGNSSIGATWNYGTGNGGYSLYVFKTNDPTNSSNECGTYGFNPGICTVSNVSNIKKDFWLGIVNDDGSGCQSTRIPVSVVINPVPVTTTTASPIVCSGTTSVPITAQSSGGFIGSSASGYYTGSAAPNLAIPDNSTTGVSSTINISGLGNINANTPIDVYLNLSHTYNYDLSAYLVGPNNCGALELSSRSGGAYDGMNLTLHTTGSFANITSLSGGAGVLNGNYLTELGVTTTPVATSIPTTVVPIVSLTGGACPIKGDWKLFIADLAGSDIGSLNSWSLKISNDARIDTVPVAIPDGSTAGVSKSFTISGVSGNINANTAIDVSLNISHPLNGELAAYLVGPNNCGALELSTFNGGGSDGMNLTLHTTGSFANIRSLSNAPGVRNGDYLTELGVTTPPVATTIPTTVVPLVSLTGGGCPINGVWKLFIADLAAFDLGSLNSAAISIRGSYTNTFSGTGTFGAVTYSGIDNATGTTNVTNFTSGSPIYVTTTDNNGCVSAQVSTSIIVQNIPAPAFVNTSICESSSTTVQGATIAGCTIDWYSAATGGTLLASGTLNYTTPVITASTTYYGQARNISTGCVSASRTPVTVNVIATTISSSSPILVNQVTTLAGASNNTAGSADGTGSGASFYYPRGVAVDASGNVYVADGGNNKIRKITPAGVVSTFAGSGAAGSAEGTGSAASFNDPKGVAVDATGNVYVADGGNNKIRKITPAGVVSTLAGRSQIQFGFMDGTGAEASFSYPSGVAVDASGNVYVADGDNSRIRKITPAGEVSTLAGGGSIVFGSDDGTGDDASFNNPQGVAVDASGNVYVADLYNNKIRKITPAGVVSTFAGSGAAGSADGTGSGASFSGPNAVAVDASGNVYVADGGNKKIRKITPAGVVSTFAGSGAIGSADGTVSAASFNSPSGIALDASGNIIVSDILNNKIRKIQQVTNVCIGSALTLTASGGATYSWSGPQTITNGVSFNATTSGVYTATNTANGCTITKSIYVNVNPLPTVTVNSPSICSGISAIVTATPGVAGTYNFIWSVPAGFTNPGNVASFGTTVPGVYSVIITNTATGCTSVSASGTVATGSNTTLAAITSITQTLVSNVCGARVYRFTATPVAGATSYNWTLPTSVGGVSGVTVDTAFSTGNIIKLKFVSNLAALTTDSIKVSATSCVSVVTKAVKLTNTLVSVPAVPASITIKPILTDSCGKKKYRYSAPALPAATTTTAAATGYVWQFVGTLGANASIDSGSLTSQTIRVSYTSDVASVIGDSIKLSYTSSCGNSVAKAAKLTNTLLVAPAAPTVTVTPISVNTCGARTYRYSASALPAATATAAAASGWSWSLPEGPTGSTGTLDSGILGGQVIIIKYTSNAAAVAGDTIRVAFKSACGLGTSKATKLTNTALPVPAAPTVTVAAVTTNECGARVYRYSASALPIATATTPAGTNWSWSLPEGTVGSTGSLDSGSLTGQVIKIKYTSNAAAVAGDTIRVAFNSACGLGTKKATKLTNTLLVAPAAPTVTVAAITTNVCGARVYRYTASALPVATATAGAATGWSWSLPEGPNGATGTLDSGVLGGQVIKIRYTSNAAAVAGDTIRVRFTSGCGLGTSKATKLTNTVLNGPLAPATVTIALVSNVCGARYYRYTAPVLPVATTTAGAATGYAWSLPVGPVGATGTLDSGVLTGAGARYIRIKYTSNLAASAGDTIKVANTSGCGNGATKAQFLSNALLACVAQAPVITKVEPKASLPMSVIVYPNPTAKSFNLMIKTASSNQSATAKVYDIQGRLIKTLVVSTNTAVNFGNELKAGVYFVEVKEGENTKTVRVVKY